MDKLILENILIKFISDSQSRIICVKSWINEETNEQQIAAYQHEIGERFELINNAKTILSELKVHKM